MSKWVGQFTCPGFIVCPQKPWPFGNEYHTISCGETNIIYRQDLIEGKDEPWQRQAKSYSELGKTIGTVMRLCQPIFGSSRVVVADSGFCILKAIVELRKKGVYMSALIKKRRYWPRGIDGDAIASHFADKDVGSVNALPGIQDGVSFHVFCMKEPDYVMSIMSTYGTLELAGGMHLREYENGGQKRQKTFAYPEVIYNHFQYRDSVDANNKDRMYPIALEEVWKTQRWPCRVFQFLLGVTEVNVRRAAVKIFGRDKLTQQEFRLELAKEMIFNTYDSLPIASNPVLRPRLIRHDFVSVKPYCKIDCKTGMQVPTKTEYLMRKCKVCHHRKRLTYCSCDPLTVLCRNCYTNHLLEVLSPA